MEPGQEFCRLPPAAPGDPPAELRGRLRAARRSAAIRSREPGVSATVTAVLLDIGGVVIPSLFESTAVPGFPAGPLGSDPAWEAVERGGLSERAYWAEVARRHPQVDVGQLWRACSQVRAEMREVVALLGRRVRVVAFTNDMGHWFGADWETRLTSLTELFDAVLEGTRLGALKPDPEAFRRAAAAIAEPPGRCLFVDDLDVNCAAARGAGMQALLFDVRRPAASVAALAAAVGLAGPGEGGGSGEGRVFRLPVGGIAGDPVH